MRKFVVCGGVAVLSFLTLSVVYSEEVSHESAKARSFLFMPQTISSEILLSEPIPSLAQKSEKNTPSGKYVDFTIERIFPDTVEMRGAEVNLTVRKRFAAPDYLDEYEITGRAFGEEYPFGAPITLKKDTFGSRETLTLKTGRGFSMIFEKISGWNELDVRAVVPSALKPESAAVLLSLVKYVPEMGIQSKKTEFHRKKNLKAAKDETSAMVFKIRKIFSDEFRVEGENIDLRIKARPEGVDDRRYEIIGRVFGMDFDFVDFTIRTDRAFLGAGGWRLEAAGVDISLKRDYFGGSARITLSGHCGDSTELLILSAALLKYLPL